MNHKVEQFFPDAASLRIYRRFEKKTKQPGTDPGPFTVPLQTRTLYETVYEVWGPGERPPLRQATREELQALYQAKLRQARG